MDEFNPIEPEFYNPADEYAPVDAPFIQPQPPQNTAQPPQNTPQPQQNTAQAPSDIRQSRVPFSQPASGDPDGIPNYVPHQYAMPTDADAASPEPPVQPVQQPVQPTAPQPAAPYPYAPQQPTGQPVYPYQQQPYQGYAPYQGGQPYTPYNGSYPSPGYVAPQKKKLSGGTLAFIIILSLVLVITIISFFSYIVYRSLSRSTAASEPQEDIGSYIDGLDDFDGAYPFGFGSSSGTTFEQEITLVAENGESQMRDTDNPDSVAKPDKDIKGISLKKLPDDTDSGDYTAQAAYDKVCDSVVSVVCYDGEITDDPSDIIAQGTGTIISSDGYLITNAHVINNSRSYAVSIILNNEEKYQAGIVGYDTWTDLALLKIDADDLKAVTFGDSELIEIGQDVIAIGDPGGTSFKNSLTKGIVSAVGRELDINRNVRYIQSDAAINPGSSGGPLCNIYGQVIGINSAKISSSLYEGMTFSIPSATVKEIVDDLMHYGYVQDRVRIGFSGVEITDEEVTYYNTPRGIYIGEIADDGSLADTEVKEGDILTAIDGVEVASFQDIYDILSEHQPGDTVTLTLYRK